MPKEAFSPGRDLAEVTEAQGYNADTGMIPRYGFYGDAADPAALPLEYEEERTFPASLAGTPAQRNNPPHTTGAPVKPGQ